MNDNSQAPSPYDLTRSIVDKVVDGSMKPDDAKSLLVRMMAATIMVAERAADHAAVAAQGQISESMIGTPQAHRGHGAKAAAEVIKQAIHQMLPPGEHPEGGVQLDAPPQPVTTEAARPGVEVKVGVDEAANNVILSFNQSLRWVGLDKTQAIELAEHIASRSEELKD